MNEYLGVLFIVAVLAGLARFLYVKHAGIVNRKPDIMFGVLQKREVIKADAKLDLTKVVGVVGK